MPGPQPVPITISPPQQAILDRLLRQHSTEPDPVAFAEDVERICSLSAYTPLLHAWGVHIVSTDELTGIQALERTAPTKPLRPGLVERREFAYERHGTLPAIVNVAVGLVGTCPAAVPATTGRAEGARWTRRSSVTAQHYSEGARNAIGGSAPATVGVR